MKAFTFAAILVLFAAAPCHAQIGRIPKANAYELGKPVKVAVETSYTVQTHEKDGLRYKVFYGYTATGKSIFVQVHALPPAAAAPGAKPPVLSEADITAVLARNKEESKWIEKPAGKIPAPRRWEREDGTAAAEFDAAAGILTVGVTAVMPERRQVDISSWTPLQLCLTESVALPPAQCVYGVKTGFMSGQGRVVGFEGSLVSAATPEVYGAKLAMVNVGDGSRGTHFGLFNLESDFRGVQAALVNVLSGKLPGQPPPPATQLSIVNYARDLDGFQIGIVNIIENGSLPFMVFFNFDSPVPDSAAQGK